MLRKWVIETERAGAAARSRPSSLPASNGAVDPAPGFIPVSMGSEPAPVDIRIELQRGATICSTENRLFLTTNPLPLPWVSLPKNSHLQRYGFLNADQDVQPLFKPTNVESQVSVRAAPQLDLNE